ncbi:MAG: response regulator [Acidobacteria bacterium]|nr:response regulator [Acidobacteriota bacterium]
MARKILLADDSVTAQNMGRKILTDAGYDVVTVNNGSAALKRVAEQKPDLIVLDVYMPGYSGLEVCVRLKDAPETARIPILLTVGKLEPFKPEEATRVRADAFIVKPFEASELLSALTRLEDRMVPAQSDGSRFSGSVSGVERFSGSDPSARKSEEDTDSGWKNRLRFPSKKKKEEPEPEPEPDFVTPSSFRDFRRGNGKAPAGSSPFPLSTAPAANQEPGLVPDIPRDITPEELDALSELVAKLDGVPAPEQVAPIGEKIGPSESASAQAPEAVAQQEAADTAPAAKTEPEFAVAAPEVTKELEVVAPAAEAARSETETVATESVAPAVETPAPVAEAAPTEVPAPEVVYQTEAAVAQEPAPIDRDDEPKFASAVDATPPAESAEVPTEAAAHESSTPVVEIPAVETVSEAAVASQTDESAKAEDSSRIDESVPAIAPAAAETGSADASSPSAEELAEALRLLTPSQSPSVPQTLAEAGAALADELSRGASGHWVAESVSLSPEEEAASLEAEMFRTFSQGSGQPAAATPASEAPAEMAVEAAPTAVEENPATTAAGNAVASTVQEQVEAPAKQEDAAQEPVEATTFADAVSANREDEDKNERKGEDDQAVAAVAASEHNGSAVANTHHEDSISENGPGGEEAMGKETKGKGGKSNWHQIRSGAPAANDAVEAAKQSEEAPKTMAAAASAENGSEASNIASIVDSVLADLRPKIVEEIAKQLSKK